MGGLDSLRNLRHANSYPADLGAVPTAAEVMQIEARVDDVRVRATNKITRHPRRIPPPPKQ